MGRAPCCDKANVKKGPWAPEEDAKLKDFIEKYGTGGNWIALPQKAGLKRCGKSCRLRWLNYLRPNIKHGEFTEEEDRIILSLYSSIGSRWSIIASQLPGRTDNDIKNYWNTKLKKKLMAIATQRKPTPFPNQYQNQNQNPPQYREVSTPYYSPMTSFTSLQNLFNNTSPLATNNTPLVTDYSVVHNQENSLGTMNYWPLKDGLFMFGGDQASCSSSDGSGTQMKQEDNFALQSGYYPPSAFEENREMVLDLDPNRGGYFGNNCNDHDQGTTTAMQCGVEEVKQQLNSYSLNNDENKTNEKDMYYYYSNYYWS
ncbi:hypothetical protein LguiB_001084 [Lonicera macranthoides]